MFRSLRARLSSLLFHWSWRLDPPGRRHRGVRTFVADRLLIWSWRIAPPYHPVGLRWDPTPERPDAPGPQRTN